MSHRKCDTSSWDISSQIVAYEPELADDPSHITIADDDDDGHDGSSLIICTTSISRGVCIEK